MGYRVTAGRVNVETEIQPGSRAVIDLYRGDAVPDDAPAEQVENLLRLGHIEAADEAPPPLEMPDDGDDGDDPDDSPVSNQQIRDWARENGIEVSDRGKIPASVIEQFNAAHQ